jgi:exopolyphosphatase
MPPDVNLHSNTGLLPFLKHARRHFLLAARNGATPHSTVYVMGNQSADLDSMISAIVYSYFFSRVDKDKRGYVPLVNLPDVPSGPELRRLRPEFACALELSISSSSTPPPAIKNSEDGIVHLLKEHIVTVATLRDALLSASSAADKDPNSRLDLDCVLVDWNSLPQKAPGAGKGSIDGLSDLVTFSVTGCIDHHVDEGFVPPLHSLPGRNPRVIELGPGSCTSLVIREIQQRGLWPSSSTVGGETRQRVDEHDDNGDVQVAKLALAAILIDTTNLTAEGKVTDADREAVSFLTERISSSSAPGAGKEWNRDAFFEQISYAKAHSLDWLTVDEILGRDYKDWVESTTAGANRVVGIASVVRPLEWIISKANEEDNNKSGSNNQSLEPFLNKLKQFATEKQLDVASVMTAFTSEDDEAGGFARELLVWGLNGGSEEYIQRFTSVAKEQLDLQEWNDFPVEGSQEYTGNLFVWKQGNLAKSRKQVAPLLREAIHS